MQRTRRRQDARARRVAGRVVLSLLLLAGAAAGLAFSSGSPGPRARPVAAHHALHVSHVASHRVTARRLAAPSPIPGLLLIADRGNDRLLLVNNAHRILWRYPGPAGPAYPFHFADDAFFGGRYRTIVSNQEEQHTIQILGFPSGRVLWRFGHANVRGSAMGYLNTPDDAYELPGGLVSVADAYNCRVLFIAHDKKVVREIGYSGNCTHNPPASLGSINGATPMPGGGTLVSEINGSWIDGFSRSGQLLFSFQAPVSYPSDPQWLGNGHILLADYARPGHALIVDEQGHVLWRYGPSSGPGMLDHPSLAMRIRSGLIAINDDYRDRVVLVSLRSHRIVWQYGHTDVKGSAPGYLDTPDGMDLLPWRVALGFPRFASKVG